MKALPTLALLAVAATLASCSTRVPPGSENFRAGYVHGCATGYHDANRPSYSELSSVVEKYGNLYETDPEYRAGWDAGHKSCFDEETDSPTMAG